ncbi:MAG: hypothetical protein QOD72_197 [Acidimicrobiaceae bacterium]|nr:hypothetical protein [Acidimicrobiaceae bacterium]
MRYCNYDGRLSIVGDDRVLDVGRGSGGRFDSDPSKIYDQWSEFSDWAQKPVGDWEPLNWQLLGPPNPVPRQVFAIGLNYADHAAEGGLPPPTFPPTFTKYPTCLTGPSAVVELPSGSVDWEVELVAVIARRAHLVAEADAWSHVAGLTIGQDISERAVQMRPPVPQFSLGKSFPGFGPTGPWVVTIDELDDPGDLAIKCSLNNEVMQDARTSELIFGVPQLIAKISSVLPLLPGDLIFTGTPSGVGVARSPAIFLKAGDKVESTIEGIGAMTTAFR